MDTGQAGFSGFTLAQTPQKITGRSISGLRRIRSKPLQNQTAGFGRNAPGSNFGFRADPVPGKIIRPAGFLIGKNPGVSQRIFRTGFFGTENAASDPLKIEAPGGSGPPLFFLSNFSGFFSWSKS